MIKHHISQRTVLIIAGVLLVIGIAIFQSDLVALAARAGILPRLDEATLVHLAITEARQYGLQGEPHAQHAVPMSLGDFAKTQGLTLESGAAQMGLTSDLPLLIVGMRGEVIWKGPGAPRSDVEGPEKFDNIFVALNAATGRVFWVGSIYPGEPLPIPLP